MCQDSLRTLKCWAGLLILLGVFYIAFIAFDVVSIGIGNIYTVTQPVVYTQASAILKQYLNIDL